MEDDQRFCKIIRRFCDSLLTFIESVRMPTETNVGIIRSKQTRTHVFDKLVSQIDELNSVVELLILNIRSIVMTINELFVTRTQENIKKFIDSVRSFLDKLVTESIFNKLSEIAIGVERQYKNIVDISIQIAVIREVVIEIFSQSIFITSIFIPQITCVTPLIDSFRKNMHNTPYSTYVLDIPDIKSIMDKLRDVETNGDIIVNIPLDVVKCLHDKDAENMTPIIQTIHQEYNKLQNAVSILTVQIAIYKKKKSSTLYNILAGCAC